MAKRKKSRSAPPAPKPRTVGFDVASDHPEVVSAIEMAQKLRQQGKADQASELIAAARAIEPGNPAILLMTGMLHEDRNSPAEAAACYGQVLQSVPGDPLARFRLAHCHVRQDELPEAILLLTGLLKQRPDLADVRRSLAHAHMAMRHPARALPHFEWLARACANIPAIDDLAIARELTGDTAGALEAYKTAMRLGAPVAPTLVLMAQAELLSGQRQNALAHVRRALAEEPDQPHGHFFLSTYFAGDIDATAALAQCEQALERTRDRAPDPLRPREALFFAAGNLRKAARRDGDFQHYKAGNDLMAQKFPDDTEAKRQAGELAREIFTGPDACPVPATASPRASAQPTFVLGMPRSATTLVEQVLASHPQAAGVGELEAFGWIAGYIRPDLPPERLERAARAYLDCYDRKTARAARVIDKSISNFDHVGDILAVFPDARFVNCLRHPLDTGLSCYQTMFQDNAVVFTTTFERFAARYRHYLDIMAFWRETFPDRILDVRYEHLVADLVSSARRMLAHVGLDWDDAVLRYYEKTGPVRTASIEQVKKPVFRSSLGKWRQYENELAPLRELLADVVAEYEATARSPLDGA